MQLKARSRQFAASLAGVGPVTAAIALMGFAALLSSILHIGVRVLASHGLPSAEIVFLRTALTLAFTMPFVFRPGTAAWRTTIPHWHIARGCIGTLSMWMWYYALSNMPLGDAAALGQTTQLFVVAGAAFWFREHVGSARALALAVGLLGALIVLKPGASGVSWVALAALGSSLLWAISLLMSKGFSRHDSVLTITFYQPLTIAPWAFLFAWPVWVTPSAQDSLLLIGMSIAAGLSNYAMVKALSLADASIAAPIDYTKLLWTTLAAFFLFGETPGVSTWVGAAMIVAASLTIALYERNRSQRSG
jgi:drug/metabolite transporter (DMT)-like permease